MAKSKLEKSNDLLSELTLEELENHFDATVKQISKKVDEETERNNNANKSLSALKMKVVKEEK